MAYAHVHTVHPPTGVTDCVAAAFTSDQQGDLIVAKASTLEVYTLGVTQDPFYDSEQTPPKQELCLRGRWSLSGVVESMAAVRPARAQRDSLLLTFRDAKVALVDFDPALADLSTVSIEPTLETDQFREGRRSFDQGPEIRVDPQNRCACMHFFDKFLAVFPFVQETGGLDDVDELFGGVSRPQAVKKDLESYVIALSDLEASNVKDFAFLHGYFEPTLILLSEPIRTWGGRLPILKNTCTLKVVSLNMAGRMHPEIWSVVGLPHDAGKLLAVPEPVGGVLVFATSCIMHFNQSTSYCLEINSLAEKERNDDFTIDVSPAVLSGEFVVATFLSERRVLLSLRNGDLYVMSLITDGRTVRKLELRRAEKESFTACGEKIAHLPDNNIFLGSRLGDSLVIHYEEPITVEEPTHFAFGDSIRGVDTKMHEGPGTEDDDVEALFASGYHGQAQQQATSHIPFGTKAYPYKFSVVDSLVNVGPIADVAIINTPNPPPLEQSDIVHTDVVTASGYGKNGALCVLQNGVRPEVVTSQLLQGCEAVFFVPLRVGGRGERLESRDVHSSNYLVLGLSKGAMVLECGEDLLEVTEKTELETEGQTLNVGAIMNGRGMVQIYESGIVVLLHDFRKVQTIPLEEGVHVIESSICDPLVLLRLSNGGLILLRANEDEVRLEIADISIPDTKTITSACLYRDEGGVLAVTCPTVPVGEDQVEDEPEMEIDLHASDDEDDLENQLYGASHKRKTTTAGVGGGGGRGASLTRRKEAENVPSLTFCIVSRTNGHLEMYTLPECREVFTAHRFSRGPLLLSDALLAWSEEAIAAAAATNIQYFKETEKAQKDPLVVELGMFKLGSRDSFPFLMALLNTGDLLIYSTFSYTHTSTAGSSRLQVRFARFHHGHDICVTHPPAIADPFSFHYPCLVPFHNIGGRRGVFVIGERPLWLFFARGTLRAHPMLGEGIISCFAPFESINFKNGFITIHSKDVLRISHLPQHFNYDTAWAVRKVPLRCTPLKVVYHVETGLLATLVSRMVPQTEFAEGIQPPSTRAPPVLEEVHEVHLISPVSWEVLDKVRLDPEEMGLSMQAVTLRVEGTLQEHSLVVVGTGWIKGENHPTRGRAILLDVQRELEMAELGVEEDTRDEEEEEGMGQMLQAQRKRKATRLKMLSGEDLKGPITALAVLEGNLLCAIGTTPSKLFVYRFQETGSLKPAGFYDSDIYTVSLNVLKNFVMLGDVSSGVRFLRWKYPALTLLAKDFDLCSVSSTEFFVDGSSLHLVVSDADMNLQIFAFDPRDPNSFSGKRLVCRADFHLGAHVSQFVRLNMGVTRSGPRRERHALLFVTTDGELGYIVPVDEGVFRRLNMLQTRLVTALPHVAGLNPKAYRLFRSEFLGRQYYRKNFVDGNLLRQYFCLDLHTQGLLARQIGTTREQIVDNELDISLATSFF